jgi:organic radical activating enzyme
VSYAPCCWIKDSTTESSVNFYHDDLTNLRQFNQQNILPERLCQACISQETAGAQSMRQGYLITHGKITVEPSLQYLDINIDYTCNLACVTCGPELSTTWRNELGIKHIPVRPNIDQFLKTKLGSLDLTNLKEIRMWGGEPLLTATHQQILEYIVEHGRAADIKLMYNTNGTRLIDEQTKKLIEKFKFARISFSIDAIDEQFEYLRYPAKWSEVENNLMWWKHNLPHNSMLSMTVTASILNVLELNSVFDWQQKNFSKSIFGDDIEVYVHQAWGTYGLEYMPENMVTHFQSMQNYCQPWLQKLNFLGNLSHELDNVTQQLHTIDQRRKLNFKHIFPQAATFLNYRL